MFVQRHFQKYQKRSADEQLVSVILKEFEDADLLLTKIIDASRAWREAWIAILTHQSRLFAEYDLLYNPIVGAGEDYQGHAPVETPADILERTYRLKTEYDELKKDLQHELNQVDLRMIGPAQDAKDSLTRAKKAIKKREDKKLDYERYQSRVDAGNKKNKMTDRDRSALTKAQSDLTIAMESYSAADDHLRLYLPPLLTAVWSLQPHLLAAQIQIQNSLLAHYYTMLSQYCSEQGFPTTSPPMDEVIRVWEDVFKPIQKEMEAMPMIVSGKAVRKSISDRDGQSGPTNGYRRPSQPNAYSSRGPSVSPARPPIPSTSPSLEAATNAIPIRSRIGSNPSSSSLLLSPQVTHTSDSGILSPSPSSSVYVTPHGFSPAGPNSDYFSRDRQTSTTSSQTSATHSQPTTPGGVHVLAAIAGKKKPPPPPPPRMNSHHFQFVTALYDFNGQSAGDLAFKEGDKIKVIKKTESTDDWWQGELRGVKGMFPANYVEV